MKPHELTKRFGMLKICDICNWDLADIRRFYMRNSEIIISTQLSRLTRMYRDFINEGIKTIRYGKYIRELKAKLGGTNNEK